MGKKILGPCFDAYNDRPFPEEYTVKGHLSHTKQDATERTLRRRGGGTN